MKIRRPSEREIPTYVVYWSEYQGKIQKLFLAIPYDGYEGFISIAESECEISDASLDGFKLVLGSPQGDMLIHSALLEDDLLERIIEHDQEAMKIFLKNIENGEPNAL